MIIEYDVLCFDRTLTIKFPEKYEYLMDEILEMLDEYYDEWHGTLVGMHTCLEEYMMDRLSETYNMWDEWRSIYYGDDEDE